MSLFQLRSKIPSGTIGALVQNLQSKLNQGPLVDRKDMHSVFAMESLDAHREDQFKRGLESLQHAINEISETHGAALGRTVATEGRAADALKFSNTHSEAQRVAAMIAGALCSNTGEYLTRPLERRPALESGDYYIGAAGAEMIGERKYGSERLTALEAFDERENKETAIYSIAYNMQAATQDEFGEALFPTCVVTPDQYGLTISMRLVMVMDDLRRNTSGEAIRDFKRMNIIRAAINPEILHNNMTKIIPVVRDETVDEGVFVDAALVPPTTILHEGVSVDTAPLQIGASYDLLGASQTDALLATGHLDSTDALDPNVVLDALYMSFGSGTDVEVIKFAGLTQVLGTTFVAAPQGNARVSMLNYVTDSLPITKLTKLADGSASVLLADLIAAGASIKLAVSVSGNINLQTAETSVIAGKVKIAEVKNAQGQPLDPKSGTGKQYADLFAKAEIFGYDLEARRVNTNRRERGQLLDISYQNVIYGVPLLSPITAPRPPAGPQQDEANYLAGLITASRIRTSNAAVQALLDAEQALAQLDTSNPDEDLFMKPEVLGVGGWLIKPFYERRKYTAPAVVDSIKSSERALDIQASLVNMIRDMTYRMHRETGYKPASDALHGGIAPKPTVIIATDIVIAGYLQVVSDFRTLGNEFDVKIVSTTNKLMKGKIIVTFGVFGEGKENAPNPLHFGTMAWKPELTLILPTVRNGSNAREISVAPSFRHVVHLPAMCSIDVEGISEVVNGKVQLNMHAIA